MKKRILVCEPDRDVRALLELSLEKLGYEAVEAGAGGVDAVLLEPGCAASRSQLRLFGDVVPPVVCLSVHPPEAELAPPETVAYLMKPIQRDRLRVALERALAA
jgi:DNA-binding response OmpR family regulator